MDDKLIASLEADEAYHRELYQSMGAEADFRRMEHCRQAITALRESGEDAARLDWLEDPAKCYWVSVQPKRNGPCIRSGQGKGLREVIDAARESEHG